VARTQQLVERKWKVGMMFYDFSKAFDTVNIEILLEKFATIGIVGDLNAEKSISFSCGSKQVMFQYVIDDSDPERVDVFNDLGVLVDRKITFVNHIESIVS
jgi:hypothetical protein